MTAVEQALVACRFLQTAPTLILWGACGYLATLVPPALGTRVASQWQRSRRIAAGIALVATLAMLPLRTGVIGDGWSDAFDTAKIVDVMLHTHVGRAWTMQATAAILLVATLPGPRSGATSLAAGLLLVTLTLSGHAVRDDGGVGVVHRIDDALHLLAGGAWLGALVALAPVLGAARQRDFRGDAMIGLRRFSTAGHVAVALVLVTGVVNALLILGHLPTDIDSPYQRRLLAKIALVAAMVALALLNRYAVVPRMRRSADAERLLRAATLAEIALGIGVVGVVAALGMTDPT